MYDDIQKQRSDLEELSFFERQVAVRLKEERNIPPDQRTECARVAAELRGLTEHSAPPRFLNSSDLTPESSFGRTRKFRHRDNIPGSPALPFSILVARPVSRGECLDNPKAMDAYWKEWRNLEAKQTWDWSTLSEWDDTSAEAHRGDSKFMSGTSSE